jgi:hypothetical protein
MKERIRLENEQKLENSHNEQIAERDDIFCHIIVNLHEGAQKIGK